MTTHELLRSYATDGSEEAFSELVRLHVDLVYSAALRQVNGDAAAAQDVVQIVFTDLARKARRLTRHTALSGWLYTSTRYAAAKVRRTELRRCIREQEAHAMNQLLMQPGPDDSWTDVRPLIDDAMHDLPASDRAAILLRFFENHSLGEVGTLLGLSENTARMRVDRALEKLRVALARRGVQSTATALAAVLVANAVSASPTSLGPRVSQAALTAATPGGAGWLPWLGTGAAKGGLAIVVVAVLGVFIATKFLRSGSDQASQVSSPGSAPIAVALRSHELPAATPQAAAVPAAAANSRSSITLHLIEADTGRPVHDAVIECSQSFSGAKTAPELAKMPVGPEGECTVDFDSAHLLALRLDSRAEGFGDKHLEWLATLHEAVPADYVLRLARATPIGGVIQDPEGNPIGGAEVTVTTDPWITSPDRLPRPESSAAHDRAISGPDGHWALNRFERKTISTLQIPGATRTGHLRAYEIQTAGDVSGQVAQLLAGTFVTILRKAATFNGIIMDASGAAVAGAKIRMRASLSITNRSDGTFTVADLQYGTNLVFVEARGFAFDAFAIDAADGNQPVPMVLRPGHTLRIQAVDENGPISGATVGVMPANWPGPIPENWTVMVGSVGRTDGDGRWTWTSAPEQQVQLNVVGSGNRSAKHVTIAADGAEYIVRLTAPTPSSPSSRVLSGIVIDATTREPVRRFLVVGGRVRRDAFGGPVGVHWGSSQSVLSATGEFKYQDQSTNRMLALKVAAEGYATAVTREYDISESPPGIEIALQPARAKKVLVLSPDGRPEPQINAGFVSAGSVLQITPQGLMKRTGASLHFVVDGEYLGDVETADDQGVITLPVDETIRKVIAAGRDGYGEATLAALATNPVVHVRPWGRIEGTFLTESNWETPPRVVVEADNVGEYVLGDGTLSADVGADGHFVVSNLPPGRFSISFGSVRPGDPPPGFRTARIAEVNIKPSETVLLSVGLHTVTWQPRLPAGLLRTPGMTYWAFLQSITNRASDDQRIELAYLPIVENAAGRLLADDVPAGTYPGWFRLMDTPVTNNDGHVSSRVLARAKVAVTVPSVPSNGTIDLGEVEFLPGSD